jgi:(p)ppGpp synthase/HD superfamily hydrolase
MSVAMRCRVIAEIAHTAVGQKRADGVTPYIVHPMRVAELVTVWHPFVGDTGGEVLDTLVAAAWLHDVVEDTKVTFSSLERWGVPPAVLFLVRLLTKQNAKHEPETPEYYAAVTAHPGARLIKCADVCANLQDIIFELDHGGTGKRWSGYITRARALPVLYGEEPFLHGVLTGTLESLDEALITARGRDPGEKFARLAYKFG